MLIGVTKETFPQERRVAIIPATVAALSKKGFSFLVEPGAGAEAGFLDGEYKERGATIASSRDEVFQKADILAAVRTVGANRENGGSDLAHYREGQYLIGTMEPLTAHDEVKKLAETRISAFALELVPRITRAQSMDVLSSMATIAGYKAVLIAADNLPRMFPMMMTAAGTIKPAKVLIVGVGVAGLQAIATSKRLGAVVSAYDIRPAVKEQVESLGARFVDLGLDTGEAEDKGGYAKEMGEEFYRKQREAMGKVIADHDVVITTAAVPGKKAPILVTREMVEGMHPASVIVDLAAEQGGNCEATKPGEAVVVNDVKVIGPLNVPATIPLHASQMFSHNIANFILNAFKGDEKKLDAEDEIVKESLVTRGGEVVQPRVREALGLSAPKAEEAPKEG